MRSDKPSVYGAEIDQPRPPRRLLIVFVYSPEPTTCSKQNDPVASLSARLPQRAVYCHTGT